MKSFSVRRKSPTLVCRRFMSSTKKTPQHLRSAKKLPGVAAAAAADAALADAVGEAVGAVAAVAAAARPGDVAAGARPAHFPTILVEPCTNGRVLLDPASFCLLASWPVWDCKSTSLIVAATTARPLTGSTIVGARARRYPNPKNIVLRW